MKAPVVFPGGCGVLEMDGLTGWLKGDGIWGQGGEKQPSSCGICLFLASIVAWLLARVTSLKVLLVSVTVGLAAVKQLMAIETAVVVRPAKPGTMQR